jgi:type IV fimbrial biogenesis protein FimT
MLVSRVIARQPGFTLIELAVTIAVLALLTVLTVPGMAAWLQNSRVRATGDAIQNGLRLAQTEAVKQNRVVAFVLTTSLANSTTMPAATGNGVGSYWYAATVPWTTYTASAINNTQTLVAAGITTSDATQVTVSGPSTVCFTPYGRPSATYVDPTGATTCGAASATYLISPAAAVTGAHPLDVTISPGGQIRMCDPNHSLAKTPDACS